MSRLCRGASILGGVSVAILVMPGLAQSVQAQLGMCCRSGDPWSCIENMPPGTCPPGYLWMAINDCGQCEHGTPWGACCNTCTGECENLSTQQECEAHGPTWYYLGDYVNCTPYNCQGGGPGQQACCLTGGDCQDMEPENCTQSGGEPQGPGTTCATTQCGGPPQPGLCCLADGTCQMVLEADCLQLGGTWGGSGLTCLGDTDENGYDDACQGKWVQAPDLATTGMDVMATWPNVVLANDFNCKETALITHITVWGSWLNDLLPPGGAGAVRFTISVHRNAPGFPNKPGLILWTRTFGAGLGELPFTYQTYMDNLQEGFFDPPSDLYIFPADTTCWKYDFDIPWDQAFCQKGRSDRPITYWLSVQLTKVATGGSALFGWKTSNRNWAAAAVWGNGVAPFSGPWTAMDYPPGHVQVGYPVDLAFAIKGSQPCSYYVACCLPSGQCTEMSESECMSLNGWPQEPEVLCSEVTCPQPPEACCFPNGSCQDIPPGDCSAQGGLPQGWGMSCTTVQCPQPMEACCFSDGSCQDIPPDECTAQGGAAQGSGTDCWTVECPQPPEACCFPNGSCSDVPAADCAAQSGTPQGPGTYCQTVVCPVIDPCWGITLGDFVEPIGIDGLDIQPFVEALLAETPTPEQVCRGDFNENDALDLGDIDGMVAALLASP